MIVCVPEQAVSHLTMSFAAQRVQSLLSWAAGQQHRPLRPVNITHLKGGHSAAGQDKLEVGHDFLPPITTYHHQLNHLMMGK